MYGLIGKKLSHSYSPLIHKELADYEYNLFEIAPENLGNFIRDSRIKGLNITIPYKKDIMVYCDKLTDVAKEIGSVNTVYRNEENELVGHNTDVFGFSYLLEKSQIAVAGKKVLILGSGGSSLTVNYVLKQKKAKEIIIISRNGKMNYKNLSLHHDSDIIINTTPVGMFPHNLEAPVDISEFSNLIGVVDLIYNPNETKLILNAKKRGIKAIGGIIMLVAQAFEAARVFTNSRLDENKIDRISSIIKKQTLNLILIGMPGAGKSSIAKELSALMHREAVDTDGLIMKKYKKTIPEIFFQVGEDGFRQYESEVVFEVGAQNSLIISTGGGCVTKAGNYDMLSQNGVIVYLKRNLPLLETTGRPLSVDVAKLFEVRKPLYEEFSDATVENNGEIQDVAKKVLEAFYEFIDN